MNRKSKFEEKWIGPFVVIKTSDCGSYRMKNIKTQEEVVAHWSNIKPVYMDKEYKENINACEEVKYFALMF